MVQEGKKANKKTQGSTKEAPTTTTKNTQPG